MIELLMQYFRKGRVVVARNLKCRLNRIKVVIFQLMMNIPIEIPTIPVLNAFTLSMYSGDSYNEFTPKELMKLPFTIANKTNQKMSRIWNFLK